MTFRTAAFRTPVTALALVLSALAVGCADNDQHAKDPSTVDSATTTNGSMMGTPDHQDANSQTVAGDTAPEANPQSANGAMGVPAKDAASLSDGDIAAITEAANRGEVDQANLALKKTKNAKVKKFAQAMLDVHTAARNDQSTLVQRASITPSSNTLSRQIGDDGASALTALEADNGADFDQAYVDLQVNEHQQVLTTLDQKLIPAAQNADLKAALIAFRPKVAEHLQHAQDLQKQLAKTSGNAAATKNPK